MYRSDAPLMKKDLHEASMSMGASTQRAYSSAGRANASVLRFHVDINRRRTARAVERRNRDPLGNRERTRAASSATATSYPSMMRRGSWIADRPGSGAKKIFQIEIPLSRSGI